VLAREQQQIVDEILDSVKAGILQKQAQETAWRGEGPEEEEASPFQPPSALRPAFAVLGPAGSGKTTAVQRVIREAAQHGCRVLLAAPTGRLAATLREKFPDLEVDTVHGAFLVYKPVHETLEVQCPYDLIVVEEVGQLTKPIFERIMEQWQAAAEIPTLVFVGDFFQLPGVGETNALQSPLWHNVMVKKRERHTMRRCKCPKLRSTLEILRSNKPSVAQLRQIKAGHKAPSLGRAGYVMNEVPMVEDVEHILAETPETMFLSVTRRAAAKLNDFAVQVLFPDQAPLAVLPADPDSNIENYYKGKLIAEEPLEVAIFAGARVILTKNLNKDIGFVNGMGATVQGLERNNVVVKTDQGRLISVHPWTSPEHVVHYPLRLGYASTLHKVQGATLKHVTLWLDVANFPAAAYVALSRVEYDAHWRYIGNPGVHHFTPARFD
jgi:ATP-dependent exoDNAse (exonuclease V) alpha subunit